ncbi:MAG: SNF2 helicase-associated domain-containing protein, partial [Caldilineales bacterium]|nr:SNF2 helicase-associated domain-containing protein [Caldilineales bacterium]
MHLELHLHWRPMASTGNPPVFLLWAESSAAPQPQLQRGRLAAKPKPREHPFVAADLSILRTIIQTVSPGLITQGGAEITLHLPSTRTGPLPSPGLVHNWQLDMNAPRLAPWLIEGLQLPLASGVTFLVQLRQESLQGEFALGSDLQYWLSAGDLVLETLARQRYVPSIHENGQGGIVSLWQPVQMSERAKQNRKALAEAMPPICRAEADQSDLFPESTSLLDCFITAVGDHMIRSWSIDAPHRLGYLHTRDSTSIWLKSLVQPDATTIPSGPETESLKSEIRQWHQNLEVVGDTSFSVGLSLLAPQKNGESNGRAHVPESGWKLEYMLQARDESGMRIPAEQVWQAPAANLVIGQHRFERPHEKLLLGLGQAARIFTPIERSLQSPAPTGVELSTPEVYNFLRNAAPLLEQNGFSLILPSWWEAAKARLGLRIYLTPVLPQPPDLLRNPEDAETKPVCYRWELVLGDAVLTPETFAELVALRSPLVQQAGQWLRLDPEQIEAGERFLE